MGTWYRPLNQIQTGLWQTVISANPKNCPWNWYNILSRINLWFTPLKITNHRKAVGHQARYFLGNLWTYNKMSNTTSTGGIRHHMNCTVLCCLAPNTCRHKPGLSKPTTLCVWIVWACQQHFYLLTASNLHTHRTGFTFYMPWSFRQITSRTPCKYAFI